MNILAPGYNFVQDVYLHRKLRARLPWKDLRFVVKQSEGFSRPILELHIGELGYVLQGAFGEVFPFDELISSMIEKARSDNPWVGMEWGI